MIWVSYNGKVFNLSKVLYFEVERKKREYYLGAMFEGDYLELAHFAKANEAHAVIKDIVSGKFDVSGKYPDVRDRQIIRRGKMKPEEIVAGVVMHS